MVNRHARKRPLAVALATLHASAMVDCVDLMPPPSRGTGCAPGSILVASPRASHLSTRRDRDREAEAASHHRQGRALALAGRVAEQPRKVLTDCTVPTDSLAAREPRRSWS